VDAIGVRWVAGAWARQSRVCRLDWRLPRLGRRDRFKIRLVYAGVGEEFVDVWIGGLAGRVGDRRASLGDHEAVVLHGPIEEQIVAAGIPVDCVVALTSHNISRPLSPMRTSCRIDP
jgi:hypothetical protein